MYVVHYVVLHCDTLLHVCQVQVGLRTYLQSNPVLLSVVLHCCTYYFFLIYVPQYVLFFSGTSLKYFTLATTLVPFNIYVLTAVPYVDSRWVTLLYVLPLLQYWKSRWLLILYVRSVVGYVPFLHLRTSVIITFSGTSKQYPTLATTLTPLTIYVFTAVGEFVSHCVTLLYVIPPLQYWKLRWLLIFYVLPAVNFSPFLHIRTSVIINFSSTSKQYPTLATTLAPLTIYVLTAVREGISHWFTLRYVCQVQLRQSTYLLSNPVLVSVVLYWCRYQFTLSNTVIHCCTYVRSA